jgi:hypothetical protein
LRDRDLEVFAARRLRADADLRAAAFRGAAFRGAAFRAAALLDRTFFVRRPAAAFFVRRAATFTARFARLTVRLTARRTALWATTVRSTAPDAMPAPAAPISVAADVIEVATSEALPAADSAAPVTALAALPSVLPTNSAARPSASPEESSTS